MPTGWTQYNLKYYGSNSACYLSSNGYVQSATYDLSDYDKVTVMVYSEPYNSNNTMTVATTVDSKTITLTNGSSFTWYTFVLDCANSDYVKLTTSGLPDMRYMKVYAGDLTATQLKATETGDATYRVITGITGKNYTVTGLTENGSFYFYVMANYTNGTIGNSNTMEVTLHESEHPYPTGDLNHDGIVDVADVTALIEFVLGYKAENMDYEGADMDGNGVYDVGDVTALIHVVLGQ